MKAKFIRNLTCKTKTVSKGHNKCNADQDSF